MAGSDEKNEGGAGEVVDASDLKARLGLKRRINKPTGPAPGGAPSAEAAVMPDATSSAAAQEAVEAAMKRAEDELAKAGPAVEDFGLMGADRTPAPGPLPSSDELKALETLPGQGRGKLVPIIAAAAIVGLVAFLLGRMMGGALGEREAHTLAVLEAKDKLVFFQEAKTATGASKLEKLIEIRAALTEAAEEIDALSKSETPDPLKLEPLFTKLIPRLKAFHGENVAFTVEDAVGSSVYNPEVAGEIAAFSVATQVLHERLGLALAEATTLLQTAAPAGAVERNLVVERGERQVGDIKFPVANAKWLATGCGEDKARECVSAPFESRTADPANPAAELVTYRMKVKTVGAKEETEIETGDFLRLDLTSVYEAQATQSKLLAFNRLATVVTELDKVAASAKWDALQKKLQEISQKETY